MAQDTLLDRFWSKVDKSDADGCWVWTGSLSGSSGYGQLRDEHGLPDFAHRIAWRMAYGLIPSDLFVCHTCDNPPCVRVDHLFLGTPLENMQDSMRKGRKTGGRTIPLIIRGEESAALPIILSVRVTEDQFRRLVAAANQDRRGVSNVIRRAIDQYVAEEAA